MSLKAVRHAKQRLAPDPRNLHWANDTNKFGFKMMEKMGWSQGKGLGAKEDGVQEHVKVRLKENHLGVGATKKSSDNWLGNTDAFSRLLADLNERVEQDSKDNSADNSKDNSDDDDNKDGSSDSDSKKEKKSKKESKEKKSKKESKEKKSKKEGKEKKEKKDKKDKKEKKSKKSSKENDDDKNSIMAAINGRKASRHKYLRNKHAALQNSERLNEILGIKSETASPATSGMSTPVLEEPMTSTDIFAARMQQNNATAKDDDEPARPMFGGLGFATSSGIGSTGYNGSGLRGLGFVKATVSVMPSTIETKVEETVVVESTLAPAASSVETSASEESAKEDKKSKKESKEKKEKKEKKDKKRKSEDSDNSRSKKSKK
ncbi:PIN2/TERF1-interacting telomerase inhibitor 1 [Linnemannia elongata]|nr:PIN2/TERF1-interacting telomerase inhibitor 1 [Linnemannia elongata]KAG0078174.1 PIN2/TERF1-interacting telomerase inhibitor 1 [Linnemannia elongata]